MSSASDRGHFWRAEDTWAVLLGFAGVAAVFSGAVASLPRPGRWLSNPFDALPPGLWLPLLGLFLGLGGASALALRAMGESRSGRHLAGFAALFAVALGLLISNTVRTPAWLAFGGVWFALPD